MNNHGDRPWRSHFVSFNLDDEKSCYHFDCGGPDDGCLIVEGSLYPTVEVGLNHFLPPEGWISVKPSDPNLTPIAE